MTPAQSMTAIDPPSSPHRRVALLVLASIHRGAWGLGLIAALIALWQLFCTIVDVPEYILPLPSDIARSMVEQRDLLLSNTWPSVRNTLLGYLAAILISFPIAICLGYSQAFRRTVYPLLVVSQVVPKVALAPLFVIWVGFGDASKILMVVLICFFPILIDAASGLSSVPHGQVLLFKSMRTRGWREFWHLRLPYSLPQLFAGLKVGMTFALTGEIVAEFVGADRGLGYVLTFARGALDTVLVFSVIGYLVIVGGIMYGLLEMLETWLMRNRRPLTR